MNDLTVKELQEILTKLVEQGHGDKEVRVSYDSDIVSTSIRRGYPVKITEYSVKLKGY